MADPNTLPAGPPAPRKLANLVVIWRFLRPL